MTGPISSYFDPNGNCTELEHIAEIFWNYRNNISKATIIKRPGATDDAEYYIYDGSGNRVRKITVANDERIEKIYLGGVEIRRVTSLDGSLKKLERFDHHVMDDTSRIAIVNHWTVDVHNRETDNPGDLNSNKIRYQYGNHLGCASLELNETGELISYEEYFPYGGTSFVVGNSKKEVKLKEYRYTGKERDDATGLYYYGARYYCPWIGRWLSADPAGPVDGWNLYEYVRGNPVGLMDPDGRESNNDIYSAQSDYDYLNVDKQGGYIYPEVNILGTYEHPDKTRVQLSRENELLSPEHIHIIETGKNWEGEGRIHLWDTPDILKWITPVLGDKEYIHEYKREWVRSYRDVIKYAAEKFNIPSELLAGVAYNEVGGSPHWEAPIVYSIREINRAIGSPIKHSQVDRDPQRTSFGDISMQVRVAAETLNYDLEHMSRSQIAEIKKSLNDPIQNILISAKHIAELRDIDFTDSKTIDSWSLADIEITATRYNRGPDISLENVKQNLSYGKAITRRIDVLRGLLYD